jgi:hypothetical protein
VEETIYRALLARIFGDGISIRTEARILLKDPRYLKAGFNSDPTHPVICLPREVGGSWFDQKSGKDSIEALIRGAASLRDELPILSHEYGHHASEYDDYEQVRAAFDKNPASVPIPSRQPLFDEEVFAWRYGREVLQSLGYQDWKWLEHIDRTCKKE